MFLILRAVGLILPSDIRRVQPGFTVPRGELYAELLPSATWYCSVSHIYRGVKQSPHNYGTQSTRFAMAPYARSSLTVAISARIRDQPIDFVRLREHAGERLTDLARVNQAGDKPNAHHRLFQLCCIKIRFH